MAFGKEDAKRGVFRSKERARQLLIFDGIKTRQSENGTPTDIDYAWDHQGKALIIGEIKYGDTPIPFGQKLFLERLVDNSRVPAILIHASHQHPDDEDVIVKDCKVVAYRTGGKWHKPKNLDMTLPELQQNFIDRTTETL